MLFVPFRVQLRLSFRAVTERCGVLIRGTDASGADAWGEFSPFPDYSPEQRGRWWAAAMEAAHGLGPQPLHADVATAAIIPETDPETAAALTRQYGCATAKVKVGGPRAAAIHASSAATNNTATNNTATTTAPPDRESTLRADAARVAAVAAALPPGGKVRIDVNGAWDLDFAVRAIKELDAAACDGGAQGLEYVEQPCASIEELAALRRRLSASTLIAADESIRLTGDIDAVVRANAADILVLKPSPLGGARAVVELAQRYDLPVVVSSAMESSVGLASALAAALALPDRGFAHGLGTGALLASDTVTQPLVPVAGRLAPRALTVAI